jgi:hypothetical protein
MLKNMGPFFVLLVLFACGEKKSVRPGLTSKSSLIEIKGEPFKAEAVPQGEVLHYQDKEKFQLTENKVSAIFREPSGDERNLLYWKHRFKNCVTKESVLNDDSLPEVEFACPSMGISVVFIQGSGKVIRVSEYEAH